MTTKRLYIQVGIITTIALAILIGGFSWLFVRVKTLNRDMQRLADMRAVQGALERLYQDERTFATAGETCEEGGMVDECNLKKYFPEIATTTDPGEFSYTVTKKPSASGYGISFTLEVGTKNMKKGTHILSEKGIQ